MANSWIEAASVLDFPLTLACPAGFGPDETILEKARSSQCQPDCRAPVIPSRRSGDADVINVDVWASMGQEAEQEQRLQLFQAYQLNAALLAKASKQRHCSPLPACASR
jgi:ornithine carbamoyltransferase